MKRITINDLNSLIGLLNRMTKNPETSYTRSAEGKLVANIGNYHLDGAYGGYKLVQMQNEGGGITEPIPTGFVPKRTLYNAIHIFLRGIEAGAK